MFKEAVPDGPGKGKEGLRRRPVEREADELTVATGNLPEAGGEPVTTGNATVRVVNGQVRGWWRRGTGLALEKAPFFLLALADAALTYAAQKSAGAVTSSLALPFPYRLGNAVWSYLRYVSNAVCPAGLSLVYPYKAHLPVFLVAVSVALLVVWSVLFLAWWRRFPYLVTGWFWFVGTLVPTIGLIQVGAQSMADRYMYLPSIGLFIAVVWGLADWVQFQPRWLRPVQLAGALALLGCLLLTSIQISYWRNTITLFTHTIEETGDNGVAYYCLGLGYQKTGDKATAEHHGLQARIAGWREESQAAKSGSAAPAAAADPELQMAKPVVPAQVIRMPEKFPDQPWKKK